MAQVTITDEEERAIRALKRLARKWPQSLRLFSCPHTLIVTKADSDGRQASITSIENIATDGGDPGPEELNQFPDVVWPHR